MADFMRTYTVFVNAPVQTVFEYCRDPRRIYAVDPKLEVRDITLTPEGLRSRVHLVSKGVVSEEATTECIEFVPDQRIVWKSHPKVSVAGMTKEISHGPTWTWTFAPEDGGTTLTLVFLEQEPAWWQRAFDVLAERTWSKQHRGWLASIKTGAEEQAAAAR